MQGSSTLLAISAELVDVRDNRRLWGGQYNRKLSDILAGIVVFKNVSVTTNSDGELVGGLPDFKARNQSTSQDSRQFQLGLKFIF